MLWTVVNILLQMCWRTGSLAYIQLASLRRGFHANTVMTTAKELYYSDRPKGDDENTIISRRYGQ
jgi:hypothetical protein